MIEYDMCECLVKETDLHKHDLLDLELCPECHAKVEGQT